MVVEVPQNGNVELAQKLIGYRRDLRRFRFTAVPGRLSFLAGTVAGLDHVAASVVNGTHIFGDQAPVADLKLAAAGFALWGTAVVARRFFKRGFMSHGGFKPQEKAATTLAVKIRANDINAKKDSSPLVTEVIEWKHKESDANLLASSAAAARIGGKAVGVEATHAAHGFFGFLRSLGHRIQSLRHHPVIHVASHHGARHAGRIAEAVGGTAGAAVSKVLPPVLTIGWFRSKHREFKARAKAMKAAEAVMERR